jgi:recombinase, phage RecT family
MNAVTEINKNLPANANGRKPSPSEIFRDQLHKQEQEIAMVLPPHMPVERFMRVVLTAVNGNPDLLQADRRSLFESAMKAAQDGLLPDGRDGALVIYNTRVEIDGKKEWIKKVQWMPMVGGILKKVRNSGELLTISAYVVYERDHFEYSLGDNEAIIHKPCLDEDRGKPRLVYAIAKTKDGGIYREIMTFSEVEKVRGISKAKDNGPWKDWWDEMAKKTVIRRLAKRLPMSSDLDDLIRRDDDLYDFQGKRADMEGLHRSLAGPTVLERLSKRNIKQLEASEGFNVEHVARETAEYIDQTASISEPSGNPQPESSEDGSAPAAETGAAMPPSPDASSSPAAEGDGGAPSDDDRAAFLKRAYADGRDARIKGRSKKSMPLEFRQDGEAMEEWLLGYDEAPTDDAEGE